MWTRSLSTAPANLRVGESAPVTATVAQGTRSFAVGYPVTADWTGSPNVFIGSRSEARPWHAAVFDPDTKQLTALKAAQIRLAVTVNDVTEQVTVALERRAAAA